jgi:hypothetical protein
MGFGLFDFAQQNPDIQAPQQEAQAIRDTAQTYRDRQERQEKTAQLKESILQQLEQGDAPQLILYTAFKAIGTATNDDEWVEAARGYLDRVYGDLMQESFIDDNAAIAEKRLEEKRAEYVDKTRRRMKYLQRETNTIYGYVQTILEHLDTLEDIPENLDKDGYKIEKK